MKNKPIGKELFNVEGKVIAIIGCLGILGRQYVEYLAGRGAIVIMGDLNYSLCKNYSKKQNSYGYRTYPLKVDNYDEASIASFFTKIVEKFGRLDVLINNAQVKPKGFYKDFETYNKKTLSKVLDGNLIGVTLACQSACKIFLNQKQGVIINVSSIYGVTGADQRIYKNAENNYSTKENLSSPISYAISKAGVIQLTKYLASYYREKNIRVNSLTPGGVYDNHNKQFENQYSFRTTLGRMANENEYNGAILFLSSDASSYMTGANLVIDGGWTAF